MPDFIASYFVEFFPIILFIGGLISTYSKFRTRHMLFEETAKERYALIEKKIDNEINHVKQYVDLKTDNMTTQINDIKKSIDQMATAIDNLCTRVYKIIDYKKD